MRQPFTTFALLSLWLFDGSHGFCLQRTERSFSCPSCLSLFPGQGNQLAAAFTASISRGNPKEERDYDDERDTVRNKQINDDEPPSSSSHWRALAASRSFVQRVFHLPSSAIKRHPHPALEGLKEHHNNGSHHTFPFHFIPRSASTSSNQEEKEDFVLYPLVGFHFVKAKGAYGDDSIKTIALPTTSHAACRLPTNRNEEVYGWFSPACKLDLYSEDVCHKPQEKQEETPHL